MNEKKLFNFSTSKGGDKRAYTKKDCDIIALCSIRQKGVLFFNVEKLQKVSKKIHMNDFMNEDDIKRTWQSSLYESQKHTFNLLKKRTKKNISFYLTKWV